MAESVLREVFEFVQFVEHLMPLPPGHCTLVKQINVFSPQATCTLYVYRLQ
ncbi:hypothetical protein ABVN80_19490 [Acinetobacter baumannii]